MTKKTKKRERGRDEHGEYEVVYPVSNRSYGVKRGSLQELAQRFGTKRYINRGPVLKQFLTGQYDYKTPHARSMATAYGAVMLVVGGLMLIGLLLNPSPELACVIPVIGGILVGFLCVVNAGNTGKGEK